jgi:chromosome segregation ATPase
VGEQQSNTPSWLDRVSVAWAGPVLAAATVAMAGGYVGLRSDLDTALARISRIERDVEQHQEQFDRFRQPGDRFTAQDGARHERRIESLEQQCQRCAESRVEVMAQLRNITEQQGRLCERLQICRAQQR